jgi:Ca2+-transporting ATPase
LRQSIDVAAIQGRGINMDEIRQFADAKDIVPETMPETVRQASDAETGLNSIEAQQLLQSGGRNELPSAKPRSLLAIAWRVVCEPMFLLLIACGGIYLLLGDLQDAAILLGSVFVIMGMSFTQERKSERALEALRDLSSPRALVLRDGRQQRIAGCEVVVGDIILLAEGDRVPADAMLFDGHGMTVDESLLSGESVPVRKEACAAAATATAQQLAAPGGDDLPLLYSGSLVVQGKGRARVVATAEQTALGRIGRALFTLPNETGRVQAETAHAVKLVALSSIGFVILLALWYGIARGDWLNGMLAGLTLAMALLPAELPLILTIFLALGAWRIAKKRVLTRRISAIEMLGAATVLCVDKTGTLTENRMAVAQLIVDGEAHAFGAVAAKPDVPELFHETLEFAMLASPRDPFDPMEQAILATGLAALGGTEHIHDSWTLVEEYPLSRQLLAMSRVWRSPDHAHYVIAAKGAPEAIIDLCHLPGIEVARITAQIDLLASQGLRVLAVARAAFGQHDLPGIQHDFEFHFSGLIGLADPLRASAAPAIAECHAAGIRVVMITGDYPATALAIARASGLAVDAGVIQGDELDGLDDAQLQQRLPGVNVFCRVQPEQKLRLVQALRRGGDIVAMTGDGVNDAPALKAAHIGIAMGGRGTDVAREAAALVLLDDDFSAIVAAVRLGRRVFDNLRKAVVFIVAAHIPIAGMSMLPVMMGWPLVLLPVHIVFFELMIDPTCSIVFEAEPEEKDVMRRPPRATDAKIFDRKLLLLGLRQGMLLFALLLAVHQLAKFAGLGDAQARTLTFSAMIVGDIWLIFINRCKSLPLRASARLPNPALWWVVAGALTMLGLALFLPVMNTLFHFGVLAPGHLALTLALVLAVLLAAGSRMRA